MRFKLLEKFLNNRELQKHYYRHVIRDNARTYNQRHGLVFGNISAEEYNQIAEDIVATPVDGVDVIGFVQKSNNTDEYRVSYCKYEISTKIFVSYFYKDNDENRPVVYTCFKTPLTKYLGKKFSTNGWDFIRDLNVGE